MLLVIGYWGTIMEWLNVVLTQQRSYDNDSTLLVREMCGKRKCSSYAYMVSFGLSSEI